MCLQYWRKRYATTRILRRDMNCLIRNRTRSFTQTTPRTRRFIHLRIQQIIPPRQGFFLGRLPRNGLIRTRACTNRTRLTGLKRQASHFIYLSHTHFKVLLLF